MAIKISGNTIIDNSRNIVEANTLSVTSLSLNGTQITASASELNYLSGVTSNVKDQIDSATATAGTLTKTFANNESVSISLSTPVSVFTGLGVTKEVPQTANVVSKGEWDVTTSGDNYDRHDTAYNVDLTPSSANSDGTFTLSSGSFANTDIGKTIEGNGGTAVLTSANGAYNIVTEFNNANTISAGSWSLYGIIIDDINGLLVSRVSSANNAANIDDILGDGSIFETYTLDNTASSISGQNALTDFGAVYSTDSQIGTHSFEIISGDTNTYLARNSPVSMGSSNLDYSISFWYKPLTVDTNFRTLFVLDDTTLAGVVADDANINTGMRISIQSGLLNLSKDGYSTKYVQSSTTLVANTWYHICATYNRAANLARLYLDGVSQGSNSVIYDVNTADLIYLVGQEPDTFNPYGGFEGLQNGAGRFDQIRIFNRELTSSDVNNVYQGSGGNFIFPDNEYLLAITNTNGQIDSRFWTDINSMTVDENLTSNNEILYAISTDNKTTWSVIDNTNGVRPIVRNNSGAWEYNSNTTYTDTTWASATTNDQFYALQQALTDVSANRMNSTQLEAVQDANHYTLGDTLDLMVALYVGSDSPFIYSDGISINHNINALNQGAIPGTDYTYDFPDSTTVRFTALTDGNYKIRAI